MDLVDDYLRRHPGELLCSTHGGAQEVRALATPREDRRGHSASSNPVPDKLRAAPASPLVSNDVGATTVAANTHGLDMDQLVGGLLSAQSVSSTLGSLTQRMRGFDEKVINLTRLVQLGQKLQDDKVAMLCAENAELRALVQRQASALSQMQREWLAVTQRVVPELQERVRQLDEAQRGLHERHQSDWAHCERTVRRTVGHVQDEVDKLTTELAGVHTTCTNLTSQLAATDCKAEAEYRKLRVLLRRKMTEAGALSTLVQKELMQVTQMAQQHVKLRLGSVCEGGGGGASGGAAASSSRTLEELKFAHRRSK